MLKRFEQENDLDAKLVKMKPSHLDQLYLRLFNTDDGLLVLRDMENRSFVNSPANGEIEEGIRQSYMSIVTRMKNAVTKEARNETY